MADRRKPGQARTFDERTRSPREVSKRNRKKSPAARLELLYPEVSGLMKLGPADLPREYPTCVNMFFSQLDTRRTELLLIPSFFFAMARLLNP